MPIGRQQETIAQLRNMKIEIKEERIEGLRKPW
jgi:hypothetical protein